MLASIQDSDQPFVVDDVIKIVVIGDSNVGKTALINRFKSNKTELNSKSTIGVEFSKRLLRLERFDRIIQAHLWDTAGQERYRAVTKQQYRGVDLALLVVDLSDTNSLESIEHWLIEIRENAPEHCELIIVGNKADLKSEGPISKTLIKLCNNMGLEYMQTSSLWDRAFIRDERNAGIQEIIVTKLEDIIERRIHITESKEQEVSFRKIGTLRSVSESQESVLLGSVNIKSQSHSQSQPVNDLKHSVNLKTEPNNRSVACAGKEGCGC